jgi:hypothetical protein
MPQSSGHSKHLSPVRIQPSWHASHSSSGVLVQMGLLTQISTTSVYVSLRVELTDRLVVEFVQLVTFVPFCI